MNERNQKRRLKREVVKMEQRVNQEIENERRKVLT
jgi:hypothetical protein